MKGDVLTGFCIKYGNHREEEVGRHFPQMALNNYFLQSLTQQTLSILLGQGKIFSDYFW